MAVATAALLTAPSPLRHTAAASGDRVPPRVYSPFGTRRLARPMAIRVDAQAATPAAGWAPWAILRDRRRARQRSA